MKNSTACLIVAIMCAASNALPDTGWSWASTVLPCAIFALIGANICAAIEGNS